MMHVGIVDDQSLFRKGMIALLLEDPSIQSIQEACDGQDFIERYQNHQSYRDIDVLLLDLEMPRVNGLEVLSFLNEQNASIKTIILTIHDDPIYVAKLVEQGACGYLLKNEDPIEVRKTIINVSEEGFYLKPSTLVAMRKGMNQISDDINAVENEKLTNRELEILALICEQQSSGEIAERLFISNRTVDGHRGNLLLKTGCKNIAGLVVYAIRTGVYNPAFQKINT